MLPRLKYHNPGVEMSVTRTDDQTGPASLTVYKSPVTSSPENRAPEREEVIDMKYKTDEGILEELTAITNGQQVEPTEQEQEELQALQEQAERSAQDAEVQKEVVAKRKREQQILEQARRSAQIETV